MATDVERLAVVIEAQTRQFERKINQLERQMDGSMRRSATAVGRLDRSFRTAAASAATFMRSFAVGAAAAAFAGLPAAISSAVSATADLGNAANRAGASAEGLQVFRRALEQNGATARDADDAMRRLSRRMGEFVNSGAGPAKAAIEGLGLSVFDAAGAMRSSDDILRQIAQRFSQIENPAIAAAYAAQLFGDDAGPRLVPLLMQGERALDNFEAQLRDANALMSNDSVQAAIAMDDAYNRLIDNMGLRWMTFVVETVQGVQEFVGTIQDAAAALNDLYESSQSPQDRLQSALASRERGWAVRGDSGFAGYFDRSSFNMPSVGSTAEIVDPRHAQAILELQGRLASTEETTRRVAQAFGHFGTTAEQSARTAGSALRDAAGEPLDLLNDQIQAANDNAEAFNQSLIGIAQGGLSDIGSALEDGKVTWQEWANIGLNAISRLLGGMNQFSGMNFGGGGGLLSGLLGSFGGFFANGGTLGAGQWGIAGETAGMQHAEIIHGPAGITPVRDLMAANSNSPQPVVINQNITVSGTIGAAEIAQAIQQGNQSVMAQIPGVSLATVTTTNRRAPGSLG